MQRVYGVNRMSLESHVSGFHHTGIVVHDLERMVEFYTQDLGLNCLMELDSVAPADGDHTGIPGARRKLVFVGFEGGHQIELIHYVDPPSADGHFQVNQFGAAHVCFVVPNVRGAYETLGAKGIQFVTEPKFREVSGKMIGVVYAQDPEGNWLEFIEGL